ncbi:MAG TPA: Na+/H+ antiporter [Casimicrobiaceae bacterium]|nr:Na+/H+ antiporter [Casimicrobiaceae bacterium]
MDTVQLVLLLSLVVAVIGALAKWLAVPVPILFVAAGAALSFVPQLGAIELDPEVFFFLFVPPLLFADGWLFPKREFFNYLRPILLLAFGLVAATVVAVGYVMHLLIPSLPLAAAFALGAIVSPTDAVATAAVTERLPLPSRTTHILNGESLINDASGLVAFRFAVAAVATGTFSLGKAATELVLVAGGGAVVGLAVGVLISQLRVRLKRFCVDDPTIQTILSLLTPYAAYSAGELMHVSGVLAVVAGGLYAGWHDLKHLSIATRRHSWEVWGMLLYVFNALAFLLLGIELKRVLSASTGAPWPQLLGAALLVYVVVTLVRVIWVYPGAYVPIIVSRTLRAQEGWLNPREVFLVAWSGIRGSVTLAAALSIPRITAVGTPFPERDMLVFLAGSTIVLTLIFNGMTLPLIIRTLGLRPDGTAQREERAARIAITQAGSNAVRTAMSALRRPEEIAYAQRLIDDYDSRSTRHLANGPRRLELEAAAAEQQRLRMTGLRAERAELHALRDQQVINEQTLRAIEAEIDHAESLAAGEPRSGHA